ncbi:phage holin family protein [Caproicibacter fermentans]|uniref:Phage holin family protein n=1 Tax=Caproicibacter fermentans TaxID=2576756 RepID=A0A7G8TBH2_9FIRM|nr:phage holin family protein [Caproicibacter fermentans]QNK40963.1 phage holin family protein [Caproicibacter fermentans]
MEKILEDCKILLVCMGGLLGWLLGGFDSLIYALVAFVGLDYATGVLLAIHDKKLSSEIGFHGICKKIMIFTLIALGHVIDQYVIGTGSALRTMLIMFYLSNEGISIIENASEMSIPIPDKLKDVLQQLSKNNDEKK